MPTPLPNELRRCGVLQATTQRLVIKTARPLWSRNHGLWAFLFLLLFAGGLTTLLSWGVTPISPLIIVLCAIVIAVMLFVYGSVHAVLVADASFSAVYSHSRAYWPLRRTKRLVISFPEIRAVGVRARSELEEAPPYVACEVFVRRANGSTVGLWSCNSPEVASQIASILASISHV